MKEGVKGEEEGRGTWAPLSVVVSIKQVVPLLIRYEISVLIQLTLGHLRYLTADVPLQPDSPPDSCVSPKTIIHRKIVNRHPAVMMVKNSPVFFESVSSGCGFARDIDGDKHLCRLSMCVTY